MAYNTNFLRVILLVIVGSLEAQRNCRSNLRFCNVVGIDILVVVFTVFVCSFLCHALSKSGVKTSLVSMIPSKSLHKYRSIRFILSNTRLNHDVLWLFDNHKTDRKLIESNKFWLKLAFADFAG